MRKRALRTLIAVGLGAGVAVAIPSVALAQEDALAAEAVQAVMDNLWIFIAGCLVFFMQAGFALLEAGLTRAKNVVNIMAKNVADMVIGILAFFAVGYAIAFGGGNDWFGDSGFFLSGSAPFDIGSSGVGNLTTASFFFFHHGGDAA